jgi:hypothetical protein
MKNYELINRWSVVGELKNLENSSNFISDDEIKKMRNALFIKKHLEDHGYYTQHFKKKNKVDDNQSDFMYVFRAEKYNYKLGDSSQTFYDAVFSVYNWLYRCNEVSKYEFV